MILLLPLGGDERSLEFALRTDDAVMLWCESSSSSSSSWFALLSTTQSATSACNSRHENDKRFSSSSRSDTSRSMTLDHNNVYNLLPGWMYRDITFFLE